MILSQAAKLFYISMTGVKAASTVGWYKKHLDCLIEYLEDPELDQVDLLSLERFRASLDRPTKANGRKGKLSPYTIHAHVRAQKRFFNFLYRRRILDKNPSEFLEKPKLPKQPRKGITPAAAAKMLEASKKSIRDYAVLLFIRDTGCRAGGVYNLLTENIDILHNKALIREKGDKERTVFFTAETAMALAMYNSVRQNPNNESFFFLSETLHTPLSYFGVYQIFRRLARQTKVQGKFSPHQWRHAAIRSWLINGMNLKSASEIAGHSSEKVTGDIYGTLDEVELHALYNQTVQKIGRDYRQPWHI